MERILYHDEANKIFLEEARFRPLDGARPESERVGCLLTLARLPE